MADRDTNAVLFDGRYERVHLTFGVGHEALDLPPGPFREILAHWDSLTRHGDIPTRAQLDPVNLHPHLHHVFLAERLPDGDYLYRVAGTSIVEAIGFDPTMKRMSAFSDRLHVAKVKQSLDEVVTRCECRFDIQRGLWFGHEWKLYRRLLMPLARADGSVGYILGCIDLIGQPSIGEEPMPPGPVPRAP